MNTNGKRQDPLNLPIYIFVVDVIGQNSFSAINDSNFIIVWKLRSGRRAWTWNVPASVFFHSNLSGSGTRGTPGSNRQLVWCWGTCGTFYSAICWLIIEVLFWTVCLTSSTFQCVLPGLLKEKNFLSRQFYWVWRLQWSRAKTFRMTT